MLNNTYQDGGGFVIIDHLYDKEYKVIYFRS